MTVELVLAPADQAGLSAALSSVYDPHSASYHHWIAQGAFETRYAPAPAVVAQAQQYLVSQGLVLQPTSSPFLLRATGPSNLVEHAFGTSLDTYTSARGQTYVSNSSPAEVPAAISSSVLGVLGLSTTAQDKPAYLLPTGVSAGTSKPSYGAGYKGSGLSPFQTQSIYGATATPAQQGTGATLALFELSGYTRSDITTWAHTYYRGFTPRITDVNVDGGPLTPQCPAGDSCNPPLDYSGDIEVNADIEQGLSVAPLVKQIVVYNAPNDQTGQTGLDEYVRIAHDDVAQSVSSSWGLCEADAGAGLALAENLVFQQMALQGQSVFVAAGDSGAFDCLNDGTANVMKVAVDDPASQPWVTSVGGTSLVGYDPQTDQHAPYPVGQESVWNPLNECQPTNLKACSALGVGAGGGGVSSFWGRPFYQAGPGVVGPYSQAAPACRFAPVGGACREVPDVSANADEYTPYSEYCTGAVKTSSFCATIPGGGWFGIGGTSLSAPLWASIVADYVGNHNGTRFGNANVSLYRLFNTGYGTYFHDITGLYQADNNNGLYFTSPGYDLATGIGSPKIGAIVGSA